MKKSRLYIIGELITIAIALTTLGGIWAVVYLFRHPPPGAGFKSLSALALAGVAITLNSIVQIRRMLRGLKELRRNEKNH